MKSLNEMTIEELNQLEEQVANRLYELTAEERKKKIEEFENLSKLEKYEYFKNQTEKYVEALTNVAENTSGEIDNLLYHIPEELPDCDEVSEKWSDRYELLNSFLSDWEELLKP